MKDDYKEIDLWTCGDEKCSNKKKKLVFWCFILLLIAIAFISIEVFLMNGYQNSHYGVLNYHSGYFLNNFLGMSVIFGPITVIALYKIDTLKIEIKNNEIIRLYLYKNKLGIDNKEDFSIHKDEKEVMYLDKNLYILCDKNKTEKFKEIEYKLKDIIKE